MKIRNQIDICLWEDIFQASDKLIECLDIDRKSFS